MSFKLSAKFKSAEEVKITQAVADKMGMSVGSFIRFAVITTVNSLHEVGKKHEQATKEEEIKSVETGADLVGESG